MKKYNMILAFTCLPFGINAAETCIFGRENIQTDTAITQTTQSSYHFQEWPAEDYAKGNIMQVTAFSKFLEDYKIDYKNKRVLSVGCGTGELEVKLAQEASYVIGIDASNSMIQFARRTHLWETKRKTETFNTYTPKATNLEFVPCPAEYFQLGKKFDLAISSFAFHWFSDKQKSLKNIAQSLEQNGLFFVNIPTANNPIPVDLIVAREMMQNLSNKDTGSSYPTIDEVIVMFNNAGFEIVKIEEQSFLWNPSKEQYSKRQWPVFISRPIIQSMSEFQQKQFFNALIDGCLAKLPQNPDGTYKDVYTGTIVLARKK